MHNAYQIRVAQSNGTYICTMVQTFMILCKNAFEVQIWYNVSKTLAEKAAWEFAEREGMQLVVLNPGTTLGPFFTPSVNTSLNILLQLLRGLSFATSIFVADLQHDEHMVQSFQKKTHGTSTNSSLTVQICTRPGA